MEDFLVKDVYQPPFTMTEEITNLVIEIGEMVGAVKVYETIYANPVLRRANRIKTIYSSLAIEQNTLSLEQVSDVIEGKRVLGPPEDIHEVKNAFEAYDRISVLDPYSIKSLLAAHKIMMGGLIKEAGVFRSGNVGVYAGKELIHAGTLAKYVPELMQQLFDWLKNSKLHPLVKSCIFHYEFEFIHPFADGNGRTGRLWQTLLLQNWKEFFAWLPVESLIHDRQDAYYKALNESNTAGESTVFVTFMLQLIKEALQEIVYRQDVGVNVGKNVGINSDTTEEKVLLLLQQDSRLTSKVLASTLGISQRQVERILKKLKETGRLIRHGSPKGGCWEVK